MTQAQTICHQTGTLNCWIGLQGTPINPGNDTKHWQWTDKTMTDFGFVNNNPENPTYGKDPWDDDKGNYEPNNGALNNITENCVELWQTELKWNDWQCKEEYYFLCNAIPTPSPSIKPSMAPTEAELPTSSPTVSITTMSAIPTVSPSMKPSLIPTMRPIESELPTYAPTLSTTFPYTASHDARNFSEAEKYCESLGSNLASLHSSLDMTQAQTICHQTGTLNCWIGLQGTPINPGNDTKHWQWTDNQDMIQAQTKCSETGTLHCWIGLIGDPIAPGSDSKNWKWTDGTSTDFGFVNNNPENPTYGKDPWD
eukprot:33877_1